MTHPLHGALAELADEVAPPVVPGAGPATQDPWRRAVLSRRRRRVGWAAALTACALVAVVVAQADVVGTPWRRTQPVAPPTGPGSMPDRIFPTRSSILTVAQSPIGRAALVYDGPWISSSSTQGTTTPIAVGADADVYRALPQASAWALSPDGRTFAYLAAPDGRSVVASRLHFVDLGTGHEKLATLPDFGFGLGSDATLLWAPDGRHLVAEVDALVAGPGPAFGSGRLLEDLVDPATDAVGSHAPPASLIDWYDDADLVEQGIDDGSGRGALLLVDAATGRTVRTFGDRSLIETGGRGTMWPSPVSTGGRLVATTAQPDNGGMHVVRVTDLESGTLAYQSPQAAVPAEDPRPVGWLTDAELAVAVNRFVTPSQGYGDGATFALLVVDVSSGRTSTILTAGRDAKVNDFQAARDVLAADRVRHARAPGQPLWDLRTLLPMVVGWFAGNSIAGVMLLLALLAGVVAFARRSRRHGRVEG